LQIKFSLPFKASFVIIGKPGCHAISLILDGRTVLLNLKFHDQRTLCTASASGDHAFIFKFCALVKRKILRGVFEIPREA